MFLTLYLEAGRRIHRDGGEPPVLGGVHHGVVGQEAQVGLGLLELHLGDGGRVLGDGPVVRVRVEHPVAGGGRARVRHRDGPRGRARRGPVVPRVPGAGDGDGQGPHVPRAGAGVARALLPGRGHEGGGRGELVICLRHQGLEIHADAGAREPQGASETGN